MTEVKQSIWLTQPERNTRLPEGIRECHDCRVMQLKYSHQRTQQFSWRHFTVTAPGAWTSEVMRDYFDVVHVFWAACHTWNKPAQMGKHMYDILIAFKRCRWQVDKQRCHYPQYCLSLQLLFIFHSDTIHIMTRMWMFDCFLWQGVVAGAKEQA